jgi:hypothetical protein
MDIDADAKPGRAGTQQVGIAQHHHPCRQRVLGERNAKIGADACRLTRGQGEGGEAQSSGRNST